MKRTMTLIALVAILALAGSALALESDHYLLDWFTPLTGGGGGTASSSHYAVAYTIGQSIVGQSNSPGYGSCLGFWCFEGAERVYLPLILSE